MAIDDLSEEQMLARVPRKEFLTTRDVQRVFGGVHEVTVYKWVSQGLLAAHRMRAKGRANVYKRTDVEKLIRDRFSPHPREHSGQEDTEEPARGNDEPGRGVGTGARRLKKEGKRR